MAVDGPTDDVQEYYDYSSEAYATDLREAQKLEPYIARPDGDVRPWYERVAEYGLSRAIDANFGPAAVNKTGTVGTYAGQNGRTYAIGSNWSPNQMQGGGNMLPLILAAAVALFALS